MVKTPHDIAFAVQSAAAGVRARRRPRRRGISIIWVLLFVPVFIILLGIVVNVANVWLARVELENGLEAAALAAVKEWAEDGPTTVSGRQAGVAYAAANCVRGKPLNIATNLDPNPGANNPNANLACCVGKENPCTTPATPPSGNLIFGAVSTDDPDCPITFNAGVKPSCGVGQVLFDASEQGQLDNAHHNAWGIAFHKTDDTPATLRITKIEINLRAKPGTTGSFVAPVTLSDNTQPYRVNCPGQGQNPDIEQPDIAGFTDPANQIQFSIGGPGNSVLTIDFFPDNVLPGVDDGFAPCDRFRFGVLTDGVGAGGGGNVDDDGDGIGYDQVGVKVYFNNNTTAEGNFANTTETSNDCCDPPLPYTEPQCGSLVVHPAEIPDLPCPPASSQINNGQSYVLLQGGSGRTFAVRAQAVAPVVSPWCNIFGCSFGTSYVTAQVTAIYDCTQRSPRLIRVDKFLCPGGEQP